MDFDDTYRELFKPVYAYILLRAQDKNLAEDLAARTWQKVFDKQNSFNPAKGNLRQWIFTIARNEINSYFRLYYVRKVFSLSDFEDDLAGGTETENMEVSAEKKQTEQILKNAMGKLKANYRDILALKFYSGMSNGQIAKTLKISESNAGTLINRALNKLKLLLEAENVA